MGKKWFLDLQQTTDHKKIKKQIEHRDKTTHNSRNKNIAIYAI